MTRAKPHIQIAVDKNITDAIDRIRPSTCSRTRWANNLMAYAILKLAEENGQGLKDVILDVDPTEEWFVRFHGLTH